MPRVQIEEHIAAPPEYVWDWPTDILEMVRPGDFSRIRAD